MKKYLLALVYLGLIAAFSFAQSNNIEYPTPVLTSEIVGKINARDIGDSRRTSHYYVFDGKQGDIFISIETNNLDGDIDIFIQEGLKPLSKIILFADSTPTQTGREIYLRKSERMILRIEGRTPTDEPATYRIKFSGSFLSIDKDEVKEEPKAPEVKAKADSDIVVNSVGTIIETKVKEPAPEIIAKTKTKKTTPAKKTNTSKSSTTAKTKNTSIVKTETPQPQADAKNQVLSKPEVVVTDELVKPKETTQSTETAVNEPSEKVSIKSKKTPAKSKVNAKNQPKPKSTVPVKSAKQQELQKALETIKLIVLFKDGGKIEKAMNEILRFGVDKGILTIVIKDGSIGRYSILEITKISIE